MRIDQRHQRQETVVRDADDSDLPLLSGIFFDEPINGVVGVGGISTGVGFWGRAADDS